MIRNFIEPGLEDLCVSHDVHIGRAGAFRSHHVIYVWIDALTTALIWQR